MVQGSMPGSQSCLEYSSEAKCCHSGYPYSWKIEYGSTQAEQGGNTLTEVVYKTPWSCLLPFGGCYLLHGRKRKQCVFVLRQLGRGSIGDAFQLCWQHVLFYAFPPFPLLVRVIEKARREGSDMMILLVPFWLCQIWFPMLVEASQCWFIPLPKHPDLISIGHMCHHDLNCLNLTAWRLGTKSLYFLKKSMTYFCSHKNLPQENLMHISGDNVPAGAERGLYIQILSLCRIYLIICYIQRPKI